MRVSNTINYLRAIPSLECVGSLHSGIDVIIVLLLFFLVIIIIVTAHVRRRGGTVIVCVFVLQDDKKDPQVSQEIQQISIIA